MRFSFTQRKRTYINLTALIDILFLLIIFFSVSTRFTNQQAIGIDLPESTTSTTVSTSDKLVIILQKDERMFINGKLVKWEDAGKAFSSDSFDRSHKVILNIDEAVNHGEVVRLLDLLKLHHFKRVVFGTYGKS